VIRPGNALIPADFWIDFKAKDSLANIWDPNSV
jgi:hypothetical protein